MKCTVGVCVCAKGTVSLCEMHRVGVCDMYGVSVCVNVQSTAHVKCSLCEVYSDFV